jgi:hypothetical protein
MEGEVIRRGRRAVTKRKSIKERVRPRTKRMMKERVKGSYSRRKITKRSKRGRYR